MTHITVFERIEELRSLQIRQFKYLILIIIYILFKLYLKLYLNIARKSLKKEKRKKEQLRQAFNYYYSTDFYANTKGRNIMRLFGFYKKSYDSSKYQETL